MLVNLRVPHVGLFLPQCLVHVRFHCWAPGRAVSQEVSGVFQRPLFAEGQELMAQGSAVTVLTAL